MKTNSLFFRAENYRLAIIATTLIAGYDVSRAQCAAGTATASSANFFTMLQNSGKPVAADKELNTVVFGYRHNFQTFGGNSGNFRYGISVNGGNSFVVDQGVLNPQSTTHGRYPNVVIYNPQTNTTSALAYIGYMAPTFDPNTGNWGGKVSGVRRLDGTGNTETYNQPNTNLVVPLSSLVRGAPGIFWSCARRVNSNNLPTNIFDIYKGQWNGSNDITWSTNTVITVPTYTSLGNTRIGDFHIAFDPTGTNGWIACNAVLPNSPDTNAYYPIFYRTINGGTTWSGPELFNYNVYSCITSSITSGVPGTDTESALVVDVDGNPHFLVPMGRSDGAYGLQFNQWHHLFDITQFYGLWTAYPVASLKTAPYTIGGIITQKFSPQAARSADGSKIFFSWADMANASLGTVNSSPNLHARAFDVVQYKWSQAKDFTSCNSTHAGNILLSHLAAEVLEPTTGQYKLAAVYNRPDTSDDVNLPSNVIYLDGSTFNNSEFTIPQPRPVYAVSPGLKVQLCQGNTVDLGLHGTFSEIRWYNNSTATVQAGLGVGVYSVAVRYQCLVDRSVFTVEMLTVTAAVFNGSICAGNSATLIAAGNAASYTWQPGGQTGSFVTVSPSVTTAYTLMGTGTGTCALNSGLTVYVDECAGLPEIASAAIEVFPVPANGPITIKSNISAQLQLHDQTGKVVQTLYAETGRETMLQTDGLAKGFYYLYSPDGKSPARKIIIH